MACDVTLIRDEVYLRIATRQIAGDFVTFNSFILEKTWKPYVHLEDLADPQQYPQGKVYVLAGRLGDMVNRGRSNVSGPREYGVQVGFQAVPSSVKADDEMDQFVSMVQELEYVCQKLVNLHPFSFTRIEYAVTPEGLPLDYLMLRKALTFEAYFTAYYQKILP